MLHFQLDVAVCFLCDVYSVYHIWYLIDLSFMSRCMSLYTLRYLLSSNYCVAYNSGLCSSLHALCSVFCLSVRVCVCKAMMVISYLNASARIKISVSSHLAMSSVHVISRHEVMSYHIYEYLVIMPSPRTI